MTDRPFLHEDFLLPTETARRLYHEYAAGQPIIDYHNHLPPAQIAQNHQFATATQIWLAGDHYKWRAMRAYGIPEGLITGTGSSDEEKFEAWAQVVPYTVRNPLYHWTRMELSVPFGIHRSLDPTSAKEIYRELNERLSEPAFRVQGLLNRARVQVLCTTDDPADDLAQHDAHRASGQGPVMLPTYRPDRIFDHDPARFSAYLTKLGDLTGAPCRTADELIMALEARARYFHERGGRLSDHGLRYIPTVWASAAEARQFVNQLMAGKPLEPYQSQALIGYLLGEVGQIYARLGWVMQLHLGAQRNNNTRLLARLGADAGVDSIGDFPQAEGLSKLLDFLDQQGALPRTILYNLNPADNEVFATMAGNFSQDGRAGWVQYGAAWWFLDQLDGMERQLDALSNMGLLSQFVGMLTDSRSFLSFSRHEYFRRILCRKLGQEIEHGLLPADISHLGGIVEGICFGNARRYLPFDPSVYPNQGLNGVSASSLETAPLHG